MACRLHSRFPPRGVGISIDRTVGRNHSRILPSPIPHVADGLALFLAWNLGAIF